MADLFAGMNLKASAPAAAPSSDDNKKAPESDGNDSAFSFLRTDEPNAQAPDVQEEAQSASSSFGFLSEMNGPGVEKKEAAKSDDGSMAQLEEALASASLAEKKAGISLGVKGASASRVIKKRRAKRVGYAREGAKMTSPAMSSQSTPEQPTRKTGMAKESTPDVRSGLAREASLGVKDSTPQESPLELPPPSEMQSELRATANGAAKGNGDGDQALTPQLDSVLDLKPTASATASKTDGEEGGESSLLDVNPNAATTPSSDVGMPTPNSTPSSTSAAAAAARASAKQEAEGGADSEMKRKGGKFLSFLSDKILKKTSKTKVPSSETDQDAQDADQGPDPDLLGTIESGADNLPTVPLSAPISLTVSAASASSDLPADDAGASTLDLEGVDLNSDSKNVDAADAEKSNTIMEDPVQRASGEVSRAVFSFEVFIRQQLAQLDTINVSLLNSQNALAQLSTEQESVDATLAEKEAAQSQLAEGEDYEAAEALNPVIEDLTTKKQKIVEELRSNTHNCDSFEKDRKVLKTKLKGSLSELSSELQKIEENEEKRVKHADADTIKSLDAKSRQLNSEEERIKLAEASNSRKERDLDAEEEAVSAQITHLTSDLVADLDTLTQEKFAVDAEVEELRRQLDEKLKLKSEICARQSELEEGILDVKKKFERQIQRLEEERRGLLAYKQECDDERSLLEAEKLDAARQKTLMLSVQQRFEALKETVAADVTAAQTLEDALVQRDEKKIGLQLSSTDEQKIHSLRLAAAEAEEAFHEANTAFEAATEQLGHLREETKRLRQKLPQIEALKKAAAKARNFKEAGAHAQEYKQSEQRLEEIQQEQKDVQDRIGEAEPEIAKSQIALKEARQALKEGEQMAEVGNYNRLHEVIRDLKAAKRKAIKRNVGREGHEVLSREVANAIGLLFESEIAEVQAEAEVLKNRYDFEDIPIDEDETDEDEDEEKDAQLEEATEESPAAQADSSSVIHDEIDGDAAALEERNAKFEAELHELRRLHSELTALNTRIDSAVEDEDFDLAAELEPGRQEKEDELESFLESHTITLEDLEKADQADSAVAQTTEGDEQDEELEEQGEDDHNLESAEDTTTLEDLEEPEQVESAVAQEGEGNEKDEEEEEEEEQDEEVDVLEGAENTEEVDEEGSQEAQDCNSTMEDAEDTEGADTQAK